MTAENLSAQGENGFPKIPKPALRSLHGAGYFRLAQLTYVSKTDLGKLHGMGGRKLCGYWSKPLPNRT